ncbi:helix-turn-helix domain-containing protein [Treponema sp.]|uniref:helix-turn-helix domain-containing protein n=1 Tax=Treponema sp. TaxID=166 RepID=UPI003F116D52
MDRSRDLSEILGSNIRRYRLKLGMTQEEFSRKIGLTSIGLSKIETGKSWPKKETLAKCVEIFNIKPFQLFTETNEDFIRYRGIVIEAISDLVEKVFARQEACEKKKTDFSLRH